MTDLAYIEAYIAISQVKAQYCRALDTKDWAAFGDVFTDDIELDTRPSGGGVTHGRDALLATVRGSIETAKTAHQVHSPEMTINGDVADVIWPMQDRVVWGAESKTGLFGLVGYGHYHERYVKQSGKWRIAKQKLTRLHMDVEPIKA